MSRMSVAALRAQVDNKFEPFEIVLEEDEAGEPVRVLRLRHLMRLSKPVRKKFAAIQEAKDAREKVLGERAKRVQTRDEIVAKRAELEEANVDPAVWPEIPELEEHDLDEVDYHAENIAYFGDVFRVVGDNEAWVDEFLEEVGDDMAFLAYVFAEWAKKTQPGEAVSSDD